MRGGAASFDVDTNLPVLTVHGKSSALEGRVHVRRSADGPVLEQIEASLPVKSIGTGMKLRDEHMRKYVFTTDTGDVPDVRFAGDKAECSKVSANQSTCQVAGSLTIRGTARPFSIALKVKEDGNKFHAVRRQRRPPQRLRHRAAVAAGGDDVRRGKAAPRVHGAAGPGGAGDLGPPGAVRDGRFTVTRASSSFASAPWPPSRGRPWPPPGARVADDDPSRVHGMCLGHLATQGGGPLNDYGRGIDEAQSLCVNQYRSDDERPEADPRRPTRPPELVDVGGRGHPTRTPFRPRVMYRNVTALSNALRVSGIFTVEGERAPRPARSYDPAARGATGFLNTALVHYQPNDAFEIAAGRDQLPSGINVPDLVPYIKSRNRLGYYDSPTQVKVYLWAGAIT